MNQQEKEQFIAKQLISLRKINELHEQLKDIDISLEKKYPVIIVEENTYFIFDLDSSGENYEFKFDNPTHREFPKGLLSAFPVECYGEQTCAVITKEAFNSLDGYISIFHEFIHCYQNRNCSEELSKTLEIKAKAIKENNYMWELNHPFPYENSTFIKKTKALYNYFNAKDYNDALNYYKEMKIYLRKIDFEYMIWQQWVEGFARYIENLMRDRVGINRNINKLEPPYDRVIFYELGSRYIDLLLTEHINLKGNIRDLYYKMYTAD